MLSQSPQLFLIDEYPNNKPFLNPICKDTYDALPKIYGRKGKKKYLYNIQEIIKNQHITFQRQCCNMEINHNLRPATQVEEKKRTNFKPNLEIAVPRAEHCRKKTCWCNLSQEILNNNIENNHQIIKPYAKPQKILFPHLKQLDEIKQSQTHHKIYQAKNITNLDKITSSNGLLMENKLEKLRQLKQSRVSRSEYVQTQPRSYRNKPTEAINETSKKLHIQGQEKNLQKNQIIKKKKRYDSQQNQSDKPYYQYIQNNPKLHINKPQERYGLSLNKDHIRRSNTHDDENLTISSISIKNQQSASTIFHTFKKKQSSRNSKEYSIKSNNNNGNVNKSFCVLSNGLFKIPETEQYQVYLSKYVPMNPELDMKKLIKKQNFHIVPIDNSVYFGQVYNEKKHGEGIMVSQKEIYEGKYENNIKIKGFQKNRDGYFSGSYSNGRRHGNGKYIWNNGQSFQGQWREGKKNGLGVWRSPKGDYYEGQWKDNRQNGKGLYVHHGSSKYRGYFKQFLKSGKGQEQFANGDKYSGMYEQGKPHGYGKYIWASGDSYEGDFIDGSRQGKGTLRKANGQVYEGEFKNDMKNGLGRQKFKSGQQFTGEFFEGERLKGKLKTKNGVQITITSD